ncbi:MAG: FimV/HubP family polar landmark protein, partial [Parahaliea sp.]
DELAGTSDDLEGFGAALPEFDDSLDSGPIQELSIEGEALEEVDDDLDLSKDFSGDLDEELEDDDLVIASEGNAVTTKLDLARAYIDMGDEDGARQILEEVLLEGSDEQQQEANELLERID